MLPAISSDLPAYLQPPKTGEENRRTSSDGFGPDAKVELSVDKAVASQSSDPGTGVYGPDGKFVESAARRSTHDQPRGDSSADPAKADQSAKTKAAQRDSGRASADGQLGSAPQMLSPNRSTPTHDRDLALSNFDSIIPPAAHEELRALADRAERAASRRKLDSDDYKKMADLMTRLGRHPDATRAIAEAKAMEEMREDASPGDAPSVLQQLVGD